MKRDGLFETGFLVSPAHEDGRNIARHNMAPTCNHRLQIFTTGVKYPPALCPPLLKIITVVLSLPMVQMCELTTAIPARAAVPWGK